MVYLTAIVLAFLVFYIFTIPVEGVDTVRYAADGIKHAQGIQSQFWEFGHLLWRPLAYVGFTTFGGLFESWFHDTDLQATSRFLIILNFVASLGAVIFLWDWMRRFSSAATAAFVAIAFCGANGFLQQICMGSAYMPAIFCQILALWLLTRAYNAGRSASLWSAGAGLSFALCTMFWFPFVISLLGLALSPLLSMSDETRWRERAIRLLKLLLPFSASFILVTFVSFVIVVNKAGVRDLHGFVKWATDANNGWSQNMNLVRAATGFPRTFYELTADGVLLKRWFLHDPYQPVSLFQIVMGPLLKLAVFYIGMLALVLLMLRVDLRQRLFLVVGSAVIPLVTFAVVVFEAGSTGRYLPAFAFLFVAIAISLQQATKFSLPALLLMFLLVTAPIANLIELGAGSRATAAEVRSQKAQLESELTRPANVFALTLHEPFYVVPISRPLDHTLWSSRYEVRDIIEQASTRVLHWRGEFAEATLASWQAGKEVWISASVLQTKPPRGSSWVEGDDKRINWNAVHSFFTQVVTDRASGGPGGFVRVADQPSNRELFNRLIHEDTPDPRVIH